MVETLLARNSDLDELPRAHDLSTYRLRLDEHFTNQADQTGQSDQIVRTDHTKHTDQTGQIHPRFII